MTTKYHNMLTFTLLLLHYSFVIPVSPLFSAVLLSLCSSFLLYYFDSPNISRAPEILNQLAHLKELVLSHNLITEFPHHLFNIQSLTSLSLSHNPLERMHANTVLVSPAILDLRMEATGLTAFPTKVCGLYTLKSLFLADNQLTILPPEVSFACVEREEESGSGRI